MIKLDTAFVGGSIAKVAETARAAERLGFDGIMTAETAHDPFLPLMIAAEHTSTIELGTAIAVAFPRSPMITAHMAWDLQHYSGGRFLLGLGTQVKGHNEKRFSVPWVAPGPRLRELVESLHAIWSCWQDNRPLSYHGKYYSFSLMTPFFNPGRIEEGRPPVYIAGVNEYMCRLAGELCDGFHIHPLNSTRYLDEVIRPLIAEGAAKAGRKIEDITLAAPCFVVMGDSDEEREGAAAAVRQQISFYASTRTYCAVLDTHGWGEVGPQLHERSQRGDWSGMADLITDEMLQAFAVIGRRDEIPGLLKKRFEGRVQRVALYLPFVPGSDDDWWQQVIQTLHA
ncbi:MAG TPA: TIGR03617 family F420-dependent LLM class oxidoreductase [Candidatus Limnocylindrales bacterium]|nr:TIGR03617 family F420-dependent LLM class oxidoreductase [Candidatus Limnocylindrales bacterium]